MVRLTDRPDMTLDVYRGRKPTIQQQQLTCCSIANLETVKVQPECEIIVDGRPPVDRVDNSSSYSKFDWKTNLCTRILNKDLNVIFGTHSDLENSAV